MMEYFFVCENFVVRDPWDFWPVLCQKNWWFSFSVSHGQALSRQIMF